jgi:putative addiction module component (TIGR02574 family)
MTSTVERLLEQVLALPEGNRAEFAARLIESLHPRDDLSDEEWAAAWGAEIRRRLAAVDSGQVETVSWEEARKVVFRRNHEHGPKDTPSS